MVPVPSLFVFLILCNFATIHALLLSIILTPFSSHFSLSVLASFFLSPFSFSASFLLFKISFLSLPPSFPLFSLCYLLFPSLSLSSNFPFLSFSPLYSSSLSSTFLLSFPFCIPPHLLNYLPPTFSSHLPFLPVRTPRSLCVTKNAAADLLGQRIYIRSRCSLAIPLPFLLCRRQPRSLKTTENESLRHRRRPHCRARGSSASATAGNSTRLSHHPVLVPVRDQRRRHRQLPQQGRAEDGSRRRVRLLVRAHARRLHLHHLLQRHRKQRLPSGHREDAPSSLRRRGLSSRRWRLFGLNA
ncbi:hypothetical protein C7M84_008492, partial [Penaeus vannamei]